MNEVDAAYRYESSDRCTDERVESKKKRQCYSWDDGVRESVPEERHSADHDPGTDYSKRRRCEDARIERLLKVAFNKGVE